jgi:aspartate carbamoyltransferase catalytic subunit
MPEGPLDARTWRRHLLGIEGLSPDDINQFLDLADGYVELNRQADKKRSLLRGRTIINCFFESSTRTRTSFEVAGKRLGTRASKIIAAGPRRAAVARVFN